VVTVMTLGMSNTTPHKSMPSQTKSLSQPSPRIPVLQRDGSGGLLNGFGGLQPPPGQSSSVVHSPQMPPKMPTT
jgi:hypothetical protein